MVNSTMVTEFILAGLVFLLMYLATNLGNLLIITFTTIDQKLHTPMYFFLRNLSILNMCCISVTVPNACAQSLTGKRTISAAACTTQIFSVIYCAYVEVMFLTIMAQDRYVAICQPLCYPINMNHQFCVQMTLTSLLSGLVYAGVHTGNTFQLPFCKSNVIHQFFCDILSLLRLSCSDTFRNELLIFVSSIGICGSCFIVIAISYTRILSMVLNFPTREQGKAFSTCIPHILLTVIILFLTTGLFAALGSITKTSSIRDLMIGMAYTVLPPFLNPIIYSLRNKEIKGAVWRLFGKINPLQK
uniref:G-protein coupled receptors family 1 profile domain-containing protein n=1 Tax=Equus asinus TaxID=9793 RepID=A0A9L0K6T2_EQUAS